MKNNVIELKFPNTISRVAGNDYGKKIYEEQVKEKIGKINENNKYIIVFPDTITSVANSFVQGFIFGLSEEVIPENFYNYFAIEGKESLKKDFMEGIFN